MPWTRDNPEELRHRIEKVEHLGNEEKKHRLAEVAQNSNNSKRHSRKVTKCVTHEDFSWVPATKKVLERTRVLNRFR